jgi:hypothetical protein
MSILSELPESSSQPPCNPGVDWREALCNDGGAGPAGVIQVPTERITRLNGLMLDLDQKLLVPENTLFPPADDPRTFLERIGPVLDRHPLLRFAEVRSSGTGLHLILRLVPPVELTSAAEQKRWATIVRAVQCSLPSDPTAPGITALTRPVGSVNSKNLATVEVLRTGTPVDPGRVEAFVRELAAAPFRTVATVLLGSERVEPCPVCRRPGSSLGALERAGMCYCCGKVTLEGLFERVYRPVGRPAAAPEELQEPAPLKPARGGRKRKPGVFGPRKPVHRKARTPRRPATS